MAEKGVYFAYDSNMWFDQMHRRCSDAKVLGVGKLHGWKWIVSNSGYANIIPSPHDVVHGVLYELEAHDEAGLDYWEGQKSTKTEVQVDVMKYKDSLSQDLVTIFTYVDANNVQEGTSKEEHTGRMSKAIADAIREGIPAGYFDIHIRKFIPENWKQQQTLGTSKDQPGPATLGNNTVYFGYGSNIWLDQMKRRCPNNKFMGVGKLDKWKWIINTRGYANIIPAVPDLVYGFVFELTPEDEKELDTYEGSGYQKEYHSIDLVEAKDTYSAGTRTALIYIDTERLKEGISKKEYVYRINMAIKDGLEQGIPKDYIDRYLRPFIPPLPGDNSSTTPVLAPK
ncbi:hypothetical protein CPB83DRAFT_847384 [Crepidotus variabilis]|uniref:gamma-glutamylcyclotransferase n=1 Tax=Crepidotus variabilis TaxID=179855 RepID=A0A9P6JU59_9AGAR|nr:hypothetical protein CPB83DRAFT_847384 [Crepidotus variabilis]